MKSFSIPPSPPLAPYILSYNIVKTPELERSPTLVGLPYSPVQVVFNFGANVHLARAGRQIQSSAFMALGPTLHSDFVRLVTGVDAVLVIFKPGCAGLFLGMPTGEP